MSSLEHVQILLGSRSYRVPREQLEAQSGFFQALFRSGMRDSSGDAVTLHGLSQEGLEGVLRHITGSPLHITGSPLHITGSPLHITGSPLHITGSPLHITGSPLHITGSPLHITGSPLQDCIPPAESRRGHKTLKPSAEEPGLMVQAPLQALVEAACYLQVHGLLSLLQSSLSADTCVDLLDVSQLHGQWDLASAALRYMAAHYHSMLQRPDFQDSPESLKEQVLEERLRGAPALLVLSQQGADTWVLFRYLEEGGGWQVMPGTVPPSMLRVRGYGATVLNNYLYVAGGSRENGQEVSAVHCYNPSTGGWSEEPAMNQKRYNFRLLAVNGALYAVGGHSLQTMESFNPAQNTWTLVAPLPDTLVEFSACESLGRIYVVGGYTPRGRNMSVLRYCPSLDEWSVFDLCRQHVRKQQMVSIEETLFVVGGFTRDPLSGQSEDSLSVHSYSTSTREWNCLKVNTSKSGLSVSCSLHNDGIYILSRDVTPNTGGRHRIFLKYCVFTGVCEYVRGPPTEGHNMQLFSLYLALHSG